MEFGLLGDGVKLLFPRPSPIPLLILFPNLFFLPLPFASQPIFDHSTIFSHPSLPSLLLHSTLTPRIPTNTSCISVIFAPSSSQMQSRGEGAEGGCVGDRRCLPPTSLNQPLAEIAFFITLVDLGLFYFSQLYILNVSNYALSVNITTSFIPEFCLLLCVFFLCFSPVFSLLSISILAMSLPVLVIQYTRCYFY
ncbi:uncharacterized protein VTP21DRAFT_7443 [Calcarisporiella thermophila]|uniref:uncharacterized protein n=1 Tax=Calcarisporiella thermophila TaxID=911321 RepID=UPI0037429447